ncbi:MAG TPA: hypothetical protein VMT03_25760 [Polyangia bacterium]|nr:hypothetical protein [Polyangia bacterium]
MKKPLITTSLLLGALALCSVASPARAEETQPPPPSSPPPSSPPPASGSSFGGGAIGIGATASFAPATLSGTDALFVYDQPVFHLVAALGYFHESHANNTSNGDFRFGIGGWYHLARASMADFSVGGTVGLDYTSGPGAGGSGTAFMIAPGAEARLFLSPNFALMGDVGLVIIFGDNNHDTDFGIGGATVAAFGFTYFFR